jgi:hydroxyacylglutathione hydrolase
VSLDILPFILGPLENNTYLLADSDTRTAAIVDPSFDAETVASAAELRGWTVTQIWLTHAHFDHFAGVSAVLKAVSHPVEIGLHTADLPLWKQSGGAANFGIQLDPMPLPNLQFSHGQILQLGQSQIEVRHTPGHSPGSVIFYSAQKNACLVGDLIFYNSVGRTDLPGGSHIQLLASIDKQVLTLPDSTRLLTGHGPETTVGIERKSNPFL